MRRDDGRHELEPRRALDLLAERAPQGVCDVDLAALQHREPGEILRHHAPDHFLDGGRLPPVAVVRLEDQLDAGIERRELVRSRADRRLLEALVADLLEVLLRHDPSGARRGRGVEREEVGPRLLELEAHPVRIDDLDRGHLVLQELRGGAAVALEAELHVLRGERIAVVEHDALAQDELVAESVLGHGPRLGERRGHGVARHGLHHGVVQRVEHLHDRDDPGCSAGSNHVGATETCTAHVIGAGLWAAAAPGSRTAASRTRETSRTPRAPGLHGCPTSVRLERVRDR